MTKQIIFVLACIFSFAACNLPESGENKLSDLPVAEPAPVMHIKDCYISTTARDTVKLSVTPDGDVVSGQLDYMLAEKDKNSGTIDGKMHGDTLLADYKFNSEGVESVRQVIFIKTDDGLKEGYAEMKEQGGKMVFIDISKADFSKSPILTKVSCE